MAEGASTLGLDVCGRKEIKFLLAFYVMLKKPHPHTCGKFNYLNNPAGLIL
jgi:hypothetical protein